MGRFGWTDRRGRRGTCQGSHQRRRAKAGPNGKRTRGIRGATRSLRKIIENFSGVLDLLRTAAEHSARPAAAIEQAEPTSP